jgi:uncharacterized protein (DUF1330 family)
MTKKNVEVAACSKAEECIHHGQDCTEEGGAGREHVCFGTEFVEEPSEEVAHEDGDVVDAAFDEPPVDDVVFVCDETTPPFTALMPVELTEEELAERGGEMSRLIHIWTKAKLDLKAYSKAANDLIKRTEGQYIEIAEQVQAGEEEREVDVYFQFDSKACIKRLYRCDTGAMVREETMTQNDLQRCLNFSVGNVNAMAGNTSQDEQPDAPDGEPEEVDTDTASEDETAPTGEFESDKDWPTSPKDMSAAEDAIL